MATEILIKTGAIQISFADHATDFVGGAAKTTVETATTLDVQFDMTGVVDGAGRESAKVDLGATRAARYSVMATFEFATEPVTGDLMELYWAPSPISTAANGNPQSIDGVDAAVPSGHSTISELLAVCQFIGTFSCSADATGTVQTGYVGIFSPAEQHGILIVMNESNDTMHSDAVEINVVFNPIVDEAQ